MCTIGYGIYPHILGHNALADDLSTFLASSISQENPSADEPNPAVRNTLRATSSQYRLRLSPKQELSSVHFARLIALRASVTTGCSMVEMFSWYKLDYSPIVRIR